MTAKEFQAWLRGYLENLDLPDVESEEAIKRIQEEADKIEAEANKVAPTINLDDLLRPEKPNLGYAHNDCNCPHGQFCNNTACPKAIKVVC